MGTDTRIYIGVWAFIKGPPNHPHPPQKKPHPAPVRLWFMTAMQCLVWAIVHGTATAESVLSASGDINERVALSFIFPEEKYGGIDADWPPVMWAICQGRLHLLAAFAARSDMKVSDIVEGHSLVYLAVEKGLRELTAVLEAFPHLSVDPLGEETSPLELAMMKKRPAAVDLLLARGANIHKLKSIWRFNELQRSEEFGPVFERHRAAHIAACSMCRPFH